MSGRRKDPLRPLTGEERMVLTQIARARSEPASHVARAKMLLAVAAGKTYQAAAEGAGRKSNDSVSQLVSRFNQEGLAALVPGHGGGPAVEYGLAEWERWQEGLTRHFTLPQALPPLRMLLVLDNLTGHKTPDFVLWLVAHGIMPLYTPLNASWLNMTESIQGILARRALAGQHPQSPADIIDWIEAVARYWNQAPTPFEWGGKRAARRQRSRQQRHALARSGACTRRPIRRPMIEKWQQSCQMTH